MHPWNNTYLMVETKGGKNMHGTTRFIKQYIYIFVGRISQNESLNPYPANVENMVSS
jgi:hypothetical protein